MLQQYQSVRLPAKLVAKMKKEAEANMRSLPKHIEYMLRLVQAHRDNPDLPMEFIEGIFEAEREIAAGMVAPFEFRDA